MPDGTRLAARIWLPPEEEAPVPAILDFLPYRQGDLMAARDAAIYPYLAARGYACARVDLRGTGNSEGIIDDEYTPQELQDGCDVIAWLAAQPWCDGNVGMTGISWGGFNSLRLHRRHPAPAGRACGPAQGPDRAWPALKRSCGRPGLAAG
jgi:putative CocE/NonD family hydrolase